MDDAIAVLQAAVDRCVKERTVGADVRLALKALRFTGIPAEALRYFWDSCHSENELGRAQNMSAALKRIELFARGRRSEVQ